MAASRKSTMPDHAKALLALNADGMAQHVTATNYGLLFRCYAVVHCSPPEQLGININPIDYSSQWGAWVAYFKAKHLPTYGMSQIGQRLAQMSAENRRGMVGWLVPAEWPSDFDAEWSAENDKYAADRFVQAQAQKRAEVAQMANQTAEDRQQVINRAMRKMALLKEQSR